MGGDEEPTAAPAAHPPLGDSFLADLPATARAAVLSAGTSVRIAAGEWLFRQGDPADEMFIIDSGRVDVLEEEDGTIRIRRVLGPGAVLGELALVTGAPRTASARARRETVLRRISGAAFRELFLRMPELALGITRAVSRRLADRGRESVERSATKVVALEGVDASVPLTRLAAHLVHQLGALAPPVRVTLVTADAAMRAARAAGLGATASDAEAIGVLGRMLDEWEDAFEIVLLQAGDPEADLRFGRVWREFCARSCDRRLLVVGPARGGPAPSAAGERPGGGGRLDLCFVDTRDAALVVGWVAAVAPAGHHFVDLTAETTAATTVGMLARRLTRRSLGVVLSGGGARGFAHLGVLATLRDAGIAIDRIGGCSIGAVVGALFAAGHSDDDILDICHRFFVRSNPLNDYAVPRTALLRGEKLRSSLRAAMGADPVEVLERPFFCVSTDLVRAETVVHRRGPLWRAVLPSVSIPGLLPPCRDGDRLLVDGGVLNNLPVDVMADAEEGPVLAVDVMRPFDTGTARPVDGGGPRPGSAQPRARARDGSTLPALAETLTRVTVLGSRRAAELNRRRADLVVAIPDDGTTLLQWSRLPVLVDAGRRAAEAVLPAVARLGAPDG